MSAVDELSKLSELKEKGVITAEEFEKQKSAILGSAVKKKSNLLWRIPLGIIAAILFVATIYGSHNKGVIDTLVACNSQDAVDSLKKAFDNSPGAQTYHYTAVDVTNMKEIAYNKQANNRTCNGKLALNSADTLSVDYTLQGKPDGGYLLTYKADIVSTDKVASPTETATKLSPAPPQAPAPEVAASTNAVGDEQQDPVIEACVQAARDKYREDIGPDGIITAGDIDGWTEQCKAEKKAK